MEDIMSREDQRKILGAKTSFQLSAIKEMGASVLQHKELSPANNLNESGSELILSPEKNAALPAPWFQPCDILSKTTSWVMLYLDFWPTELWDSKIGVVLSS